MKKELKSKGQIAYAAAKRKPDFEKDRQEIIERYEIPVPPAHTREEFEKWSLNTFEAAMWFFEPPPTLRIPKMYKGMDWTGKYLLDRIAFLEKYNLSIDMYGEAMDAVLLGEAPSEANVSILPAEWRSVGSKRRRAVSILIQEGASREEVLDFIKDRWRYWIKPGLEGERKGIRALKDEKFLQIILDYNALPISQLKKRSGLEDNNGPILRPMYISTALEREHGIKASSEKVRKLIERSRKL